MELDIYSSNKQLNNMEPIPQQPTEIQILKSDAYDCLAQIEYWKKMLQEINQKIAQIQQQIKNP